MDDTQQYLTRDCLEITGVPITPHDNPNQIVKEIGSLIGVDVNDSDIAAAHKLPAFKKVKNHMIKFLQRDRERKFTRSERIWLHEKTQVICTVNIKYAGLVSFGCHNPVVNSILNIMDRLAQGINTLSLASG